MKDSENKLKSVPIVFSHNDFYYRNILWEKEKNKFHLIDFEYVSPNYLMIDLVNFLNELISDYDHPEAPFYKYSPSDFPDNKDIREMVKFYIYLYEKYDSLKEDILNHPEFIAKVKNSHDYLHFDKEIVEKYVSLIPLFGKLINIFWFYWSLYIFETPLVDFDMVEFAQYKMKLFEFYSTLKIE